jgi:predicted membrane-bound spermidine synthase
MYAEDMYLYRDFSNLVSLLAMIGLAGLPFFFAGVCIGFLISRAGEDVNRIYFADLIGAAAGSVLAVVLITRLGATATCILVGATGFLVAAIAGGGRRIRYSVLFVLWAGVSVWQAQTEWLRLYAPPDKPLFRREFQVETIEWHPIARIDVTLPFEGHHSFGGALAPNWQGPPPVTRLVFQDAGALTGIIKPNGTPENTPVLGQYMQGAAYAIRPGAEALIIGCGGGVDIEIALHNRARKVVGVDVNPKTVELIRGKYSQFAGGVFQRDEVELVVSEGRHFLTRDDRAFDVIQMSGVDTYSALAAGAYALTENFIYTREALHQYLDHLNPDGIVNITRPLLRPPRETLKLAVTWVDVLTERGRPNPEAHVIILAGQGQGSFFGVPWGLTMVKESPFTESEVATIESWAAARQFSVAYAPFGRGRGKLANYLTASPEKRERMLAEDPRELTPATDDRPFFFHFYPWRDLFTFQWLAADEDDPQLSIAVILMLATLIMVTVLSAVFILVPLARHRLPKAGAPRAAAFLYFASLGLGFILIELALLQKLTIFLGGPTYTMAVTLFAVLFFSGFGSLASRRLAADPLKLIAVCVPVLAVLSVAASVSFGPVTDRLLGLSHAGRIAAAVALVAPLGFCMGMPFPAGLLILNRQQPELTPWAWGINACMTVMGTVLCIMLSTAYGFGRTMQIGAAVYLIGWLAFWLSERRRAAGTGPRAA